MVDNRQVNSELIDENSKKYFFSDFTQAHYRELLILARQRFAFSFYTDFQDKPNFILWRHDVDFSLEYSYQLAVIENELGVKATYFLHLHSEYYNLLEKGSSDIVKKIIALGHTIAVHFDTHYYTINSEESIVSALHFEQKLLENIFDTKIYAFSFHRTDAFVLSCNKWMYGGLINTYAKYFQTEVPYCSDSHGIWRYRRMSDVLQDEKVKNIQALTHPEWWQEQVRSPKERIDHIIDKRARDNKLFYEETLNAMAWKAIDWV